MRSKNLARVLAVFLTATLLLPTAACQKKAQVVDDKDKGDVEQSTLSGQSDVISGTQLADTPVVAGDIVSGEAYYSSVNIEFPATPEGRSSQMLDFDMSDERIVFLISEYADIDWFAEKTEEQWAAMEQESFDSQEHILLFYDFDGNLINQTNLELGSIVTDPAVYVKSMFVNAAGEISLYVSRNIEGDQIFSVNEQGQIKDQGVTLAPLGGGSSNHDAAALAAGMEVSGYIMALRGVGENIVAVTRLFKDDGSASYDMIAYNGSGEELFRVNSSELTGVGENTEFDEIVFSDGTSTYVREIFSQMIYKVDFENQTLVPLSDRTYNTVMSGSGNLCVTDTNDVLSLDANTGEATQLFSWKNLDISIPGSYLNASVMMLSEDRLLVKSGVYANEPAQFLVLKKEAVNPNQGKAIIRIGGMDVSYNPILEEAVYDFNRKSDSYRAELIEYRPEEDAESMEDYDAQYDAMNMRILSGDMPDVFVETNLYYNYISRYAGRNLFSDLYPFMENDPDFRREDYYENILTLPEMDGQLPYMIPFYTLNGFFGKKEVLSNRTGWTFAEFEEFGSQLPASMQLLKTGNDLELLESLTAGHMESLIDYTASPAKANFDSDEFRQILQFCSTHGKSLSKMESMDIYEFEDMARDELALSFDSSYIRNASEFAYPWNTIGMPITLIGYPSATSDGPVCESIIAAAIFADSPYQDAGWEFMKILLSEELQNEIADDAWGGYLLTHKGALDYAISDAQKETSNNNREGMFSNAGMNSPVHAADEWAATLKDIVASANVLSVRNQDVLDIVREESQAYFAGQKTMDDAIAVIQSKVTTHLNEQS